jgi:hypothetical protein
MKIYPILLSLLLLAAATSKGNGHPAKKITGYDLKSPDTYQTFPGILKEISGLTYIDSTSFACIQDELGILFVYDFREKRVKQQQVFFEKGDYEDVARVNKTIYILRSDGALFEISDYTSASLTLNIYDTEIPSGDNEGLCYDSKYNRLLIGCKGEIRKDNFKKKQAIYSFDLKTKKTVANPAYVLSTKALNQFVKDNKVKDHKKDDKGIESQLQISALAIHPLTGEIYILSAADNLICVIGRDGLVKNVEFLDRKLFGQPEGLTFLKNGDMLITNEGGNDNATLLRFSYRTSP